ncbi:hypothetical protein, partial [Enterobacter hormaechei]|uniref:hypothetical protein n=1 Tax=Enterobacter hormaechei TaxID=158836 RepID=UPI00195B3E83
MTAINSPPLCRGGRIFTDFAMCNRFSINLGLGELAKTPRYLVSKGSNTRGWYEVYSDGFIRQGMKFPNNA